MEALITFATISVTFALAGSADAGPGGVAQLRPVVVLAGGADDSLESEADSTGFTNVIDTSESWRGYDTVGDVIDQSVGVRVRRFGGREDFATATVRGSAPGQVKVLLDGVNLSRAENQIVNLSDLPLDSVDRIEVYRGFTPIAFASSGAASVINIVTREGEAQRASAAVTAGSFDTYRVALHAHELLGSGTLAGLLSLRSTEGDFKFRNDNGTPLTPADDFDDRRRNNRRLSWDLLARHRQRLGNGSQLTLSNNVFYKDEGVPGLVPFQSRNASQRNLRNISTLSWQDANSSFSANLTWLREDLRDPKDAASSDVGLNLPYPRARNLTVAAAVDGHRRLVADDTHLVEASFELSVEGFKGRRFLSSGTDRSVERRAALAVALGDEIYLSGPRLLFSPQIRHEVVWNDFDGEGPGAEPGDPGRPRHRSTDPRIGVRWQAAPSLTFKANLGTYFRPPNFGELFGDRGFSIANSELGPERGVNRDLGLSWHWRGRGSVTSLFLEYSWFDNDSDDMIVFIQTGTRQTKADNVGSARVRGHELRLDLATGSGLSLETNYSSQDASNLTNAPSSHSRVLPGIPEQELFARLRLDRGSWNLAWEYDYRGRIFLDLANFVAVGGRSLHNLSFGLNPFGPDLELRLEANNLTNEQALDVFGFPLPGRSWYFTLSYSPGARGRG
ncbi:MAG: TonB-dependent receptor [Candidatus Binatia bacterium]